MWFGCAVSPKSLQCHETGGNVHCFELATERTHTNASEAPIAFDELFGVAPTSPSAHVQLISPDQKSLQCHETRGNVHCFERATQRTESSSGRHSAQKSLQCHETGGNVHCFEWATQRTHTNASEAPTAFD